MSAKFKNDSPIYAILITHLLYTLAINRLEKYSNASLFNIVLFPWVIFDNNLYIYTYKRSNSLKRIRLFNFENFLFLSEKKTAETILSFRRCWLDLGCGNSGEPARFELHVR